MWAMMEAQEDMQHLREKVEVRDEMVVDIGGKEFFVVHRPIQARDDMPTLCGHVHERWTFLQAGAEISEHSRNMDKTVKKLKQPILNVGCDVHNYKPISDDQVLEYFK
jgi:calcineurin-like phosphoesterase family protein